jgi:kynurenine formamidase
MCDRDSECGRGWKGWRSIPPADEMRATGDWVDLSHSLTADTPRVPQFPAPVFERIVSQPERQLNVTRMEMVVHIGTHIDSPRHFFLDGPAFEEIPLARMSGRGVVWPVQIDDDELIEPSHLAGIEAVWRRGDILPLNTGWHAYVGSRKYDDDHPALSMAAAEWMVKRGVKLVGLDIPTPDIPVTKRPANFDYPIHRHLLSHGVLIAEHLIGLEPLNGRVVEVLCMGLKIVGGDGAPARIVARPIERAVSE